MAEISYTNTVNVTLVGTPRGMAAFNTNNICLFTNEVANFADAYKVYVSSASVANDFGSDSLTAKMANAMFAQSPNLRTGTGSLIIAPYVATNATSGYAQTPNIANNVENFKSVTDGEFILTVDNKQIKFSGLDFSSVTNIEDIVTILLNRNPDVNIEVVTNDLEKAIKFTSKGLGTTSTVAFSSASGSGTDLTGASYLNTSAILPVAGKNAVNGEKLSDAVLRVAEKTFFGVILDTCLRENESIIENAKAIEAVSKKLYIESTGSLNNISVLGDAILKGGYKKTRIFAYSYGNAKVAVAAYASRACATNYSGSNTALTMNLKELATIAPDENCNDNTFSQAKQYGVDIYGATSGLGCTYSFKNGGGYTDDQTGLMAFTGDIEVALFNTLKQTNTKIPQTEAGMTVLKNAAANVCEKYVRNGWIGTGLKWNSPDKFGDVEDFDRNITDNGYYIYSLPIAEQDQAERETRTAPLIQMAVKSGGAIHIVNVFGQVES